jgi:hypothetical protein
LGAGPGRGRRRAGTRGECWPTGWDEGRWLVVGQGAGRVENGAEAGVYLTAMACADVSAILSDVIALDTLFTLRDGLQGGQSRNAVTEAPSSPCGSKNRYVLHTVVARKSNGAQQISQSEPPMTGSSVFGGELSARPVSLRESISGTPQPTELRESPFTPRSEGVLRGIGTIQHAFLSSLLEYSISSRITAQIRMDNLPL